MRLSMVMLSAGRGPTCNQLISIDLLHFVDEKTQLGESCRHAYGGANQANDWKRADRPKAVVHPLQLVARRDDSGSHDGSRRRTPI
jgi:hypothetical protein